MAALARRSLWERAVCLAAETPATCTAANICQSAGPNSDRYSPHAQADFGDTRLKDAALAAFSRSRRWRQANLPAIVTEHLLLRLCFPA